MNDNKIFMRIKQIRIATVIMAVIMSVTALLAGKTEKYIQAEEQTVPIAVCDFREEITYAAENYVRYTSLPIVQAFTVQDHVSALGIGKDDTLGYIIYRSTYLCSRDGTESGYYYNVLAYECEVKPVCVNNEKGICAYPEICSLAFSVPTTRDITAVPDILMFERKSDVTASYEVTLPLTVNINNNADNAGYAVTKNLIYQANALYCVTAGSVQYPEIRFTYKHYGDTKADSWIHRTTYVSGLEGFFGRKSDMAGQSITCEANVLFGADYVAGDRAGTAIEQQGDAVLCNWDGKLTFKY